MKFRGSVGLPTSKCGGLYDIDWIIDKNGDKVGEIWDYHFINDRPGTMAEVEESQPYKKSIIDEPSATDM